MSLVASVCLLICGDRDPETPHELVQRALAALIADLTRAPQHLGAREPGLLPQPRFDLGSERGHGRRTAHSAGLQPGAGRTAVGVDRLVDRRAIDRHCLNPPAYRKSKSDT